MTAMTVKAPKPPRDLGARGRALWRRITTQVAEDGLELDKRELELLRCAATETDMLNIIETAFAGQPAVVKGAQGQLVAHPLLGEARRSRAAIASLLKQIGLVDPMDIPTARGSRTTSTSARAAALARHRAV